jgi:hypothetical protein
MPITKSKPPPLPVENNNFHYLRLGGGQKPKAEAKGAVGLIVKALRLYLSINTRSTHDLTMPNFN